MTLTDPQIDLYSRQIILRELGAGGQRRLLRSSCLVLGRGSAIDLAASYLAGAGVGRIDVVRLAGETTRTPGPLAPLEERCPDATIAYLGSLSGIDLGAYQVLLAHLPALAPERVTAAQGRAQKGEIAFRLDESSGTGELLLLPSSAPGCPWCVRATLLESVTATVADLLVEPLAATFAALAALRWIAGIGEDDRPRAFALDPGAPTWREVPTRREPACVRGCRT